MSVVAVVEKKQKKTKKRKKDTSTELVDIAKERLSRHIPASSVQEIANVNKDDEEVIISMAEQVEARFRSNKKANKQKKKAEKAATATAQHRHVSGTTTADAVGGSKNSIDSEKKKRVKFDKVNRCKSHTASMKALITSTPPKTKDRTPEKGILRTKSWGSAGKLQSTVLSKAGRKKATSYF